MYFLRLGIAVLLKTCISTVILLISYVVSCDSKM